MSSISEISKNNAEQLGKQTLLWQTIEECCELGKAISKYNRTIGFGQTTEVKSKDAYIDMLKEVADVSICIEQLIYLFGMEEDVEKYRNEAFEKVRKRYDGDTVVETEKFKPRRNEEVENE